MITGEQLMDTWGGEALHIYRDDAAEAWIIIAVHSTRRGPSAGGIRMKSYSHLGEAIQDAMKLSAAMTMKFAAVNMSWGGGKTVVYLTKPLDEASRHALLLLLGLHIKKLSGQYYAGPDIGTSSEDMDVLHGVAAPYIFSRTPATGGSGSSSIPTAYGVFAAIKATCRQIFGEADLRGKRILIQGMGNVGRYLAGLLKQEEAIILFSETNTELVKKLLTTTDYVWVAPEALFDTPCDIFSPCAQGGILDSKTIPRLKCRGIAGAANNQLLDPATDAELLGLRNILYAPDFVANLGGAMGITLMEAEGVDEEVAMLRVQTDIAAALEAIFRLAGEEGLHTLEAAQRWIGNNFS